MALVNGSAASETLLTDQVYAQPNDNVYGYGGNDTIVAGTGTNMYDGGFGIDTVDYSQTSPIAGVPQSVIANLTTGVSVAKYAAGPAYDSSDTLVNVENLKGTNLGADKLTGDALNNRLDGLGGNDTLDGRDGADTLLGGAGDDTLIGGKGDDVLLNGGQGNDTYKWKAGDGVDNYADNGTGTALVNHDEIEVLNSADFNGLTAVFGTANGIEEISGTGNIDGTAEMVNWNFSKVDLNGASITLGDFAGNKVVGSSADDTMNGGALKDTLSGGNGDDNLFGNAGNDTLNGQNGNDDLSGGAGIDVMNGGNGNDFLDGGAGKDTYTGGAGSDLFWIKEGEASSNTAQADMIKDFQGVGMTVGDQDAIVFDTSDGTGMLWMAQSISVNQAILGFADSTGLASYVNLTVDGTIANFMLNTSGEYSFA